jgi:hypothetical protein
MLYLMKISGDRRGSTTSCFRASTCRYGQMWASRHKLMRLPGSINLISHKPKENSADTSTWKLTCRATPPSSSNLMRLLTMPAAAARLAASAPASSNVHPSASAANAAAFAAKSSCSPSSCASPGGTSSPTSRRTVEVAAMAAGQ